MKKILSLLLAMAMLFSLCPTFTMAAEAANDVKLFDAHITGNVVIGGTLTANFSPALTDADIANLCPGLDVEKTIASIVWYSKNRYGSRSSGTKSLSNNGKLTYTVPSTYVTTNNPAIFFKVTPTNANGEAIGETVYSTISYMPLQIDETATAPVVYNAHISPLNGDGVIGVGKTVAARYAFVYRKSATIGEMNSKYTWFTSDELLKSGSEIEANATKVQEESTTATYTIKPQDAGKYLYAKIVAVAADGTESASAVYTKNHLGNAFLPNANSLSGHSVSAINPSASYPVIKLLADGCSPISGNHMPSTFMQSYSNDAGVDRTITVDAGKEVNFDGIFLAHGYSSIKNYSISCSADGASWTDLVPTSANVLSAPGENEFLFDSVLSARYFKLTVQQNSSGSLNIDEFYPFIRKTTAVNFTKADFAQLNGKNVEVKAWGTPLSEVKKAENGFEVVSDLDTEGSTAVGDSIAAAATFVTKSVTSDGDVYTEISNPENIKVTDALENTYLKVDDGKDVAYYEVCYAGNIVETEDEVITSAAGGVANSLKFVGDAPVQTDSEGNTVGKYLLKTQIKIPKLSETSNGRGIRTTINVAQGKQTMTYVLVLNGWYTLTNWGDSSWETREIGIPKGGIHTGYFFKLDKWLDLEMLFDFDTADAENGTINITTWIDGVLIAEDVHPWTDPKTFSGGNASVLTPTLQLYPNNSVDMVYHKNSSLRQVWDADTHTVENNYSINLANAEDALQAPVTTLTAGKYTLASNQNVYKAGLGNYVAKYYVSADGSKELKDVVAVVNAEDFVTVTEEELAEKTVEVKGFSFHGQLTPNYQAVSINE